MELIVLGLVAGIGIASYALWSRARASDAPLSPPELESGDRTVATLQVGDIVQHLGTDWIVEGCLQLADDSRSLHLYRLVDGAAERYLFVSANEPDPSLLSAAPELRLEGSPESLEHAGQAYTLRARATGNAIRSGVVGTRRQNPFGERMGLVEYAAGALRLVVLHWGDRSDAFLGERVATHLLELLPSK
jgi:hypothetical protein